MQGARRGSESASAVATLTATTDPQEALALNTYLQSQLQEDVAKIFDESLYTDLEIVFGRSKILTHSCILKTRTERFYKKLEGILHIDINRKTYEEIDSFVSDVYTECNIKHQEDGIIEFLERFDGKTLPSNADLLAEKDIFLTPKSNSPCTPHTRTPPHNLTSSPSVDLKREFYELVPVEPNLLEQELTEQDQLLSGLQSIIRHQLSGEEPTTTRTKPTYLSLRSSHTSKIVKHSNSCDKLVKKAKNSKLGRNCNTNIQYNQRPLIKDIKYMSRSVDESEIVILNTVCGENTICVKSTEDVSFSPDSLVGDDPSSSSDFLSAAYGTTPVASSTYKPFYAGKKDKKMENLITNSDSGLESSCLLESVGSHRDLTVSDSSCLDLTESTLHDDIPREENRSTRLLQDKLPCENNSILSSISRSISSPVLEGSHPKIVPSNEVISSNSSCLESSSANEQLARWDRRENHQTSSKEEKQRLNEEIVTLESSSLSSETGSWESVFPPQISQVKETCVKFIENERKDPTDVITANNDSEAELTLASINSASLLPEGACPSLVQSSPFKTMSCFIDAASLVDDDDSTEAHCRISVFSCEPEDVQVSCTVETDASPTHYSQSEAVDNDDSLERDGLGKDKDLSPATMETTPITEDSLLCDAKTEQVTDPLHLVNTVCSWTVNMSENSTAGHSVEHSNGVNSQSRDSCNSEITERSSQKFFIDLSSLPEPSKGNEENGHKSEKKNMFSLFISLGDNNHIKDGPTISSNRHTRLPKGNNKISSSPRGKSPGDKKEQRAKPPLTTNTAATNNPPDKQCVPGNNGRNGTPYLDAVIKAFDKYVADSDSNINSNANFLEVEKIANVVPIEVEWNHKAVLETISETHTQKSILDEEQSLSNTGHSPNLFVKLSDLDKPIPKILMDSLKESVAYDVRMTRSLPQENRAEQHFFSSLHSENAKSLNRLFPHLKNELSRSVLEREDKDTASDTSRSNNELSTPEFDSRLGQDLLRMFTEEIASDVTVEVAGRRIRAHKCILSSRCQYFAGALSGGFVQSAGNVITLPGFSYNVVHFALCHIYSGASTIPECISIVELVALADMLELEGLKEVIMFTLKLKYCHNFHKPCDVCTVGVLECLTLTSAYGLEEVYQKSLRWITKYFVKIWPTKAFATLPKELVEKCYQQHVHNMTLKNVVDTVCGCGKIGSVLPSARWAEVIKRICRLLVNAAAQFAAFHLAAVLDSVMSTSTAIDRSTQQVLNEWILKAIEWAAVEHICQAYELLTTHADGHERSLVKRWKIMCEETLLHTPAHTLRAGLRALPPELRSRLQERGCLCMPETNVLSSPGRQLSQKRTTKNTYLNNLVKVRSDTHSPSIDRLRSEFIPYAAKPIAPSRSVDSRSHQLLSTVRRSEPPVVQKTKTSQQRAMHNASLRESQVHLPLKAAGKKPHLNVKSRYLEPRPESKQRERCSIAERAVKTGSSTESSRNSSPLLGRGTGGARARCSRVDAKQPADLKALHPQRQSSQSVSQESLTRSTRPSNEISTDSLSESLGADKYATYTKSKNKEHSTRTATASIERKYSQSTRIPVLVRPKDTISKQYPNDIRHDHYKMKTLASTSTSSASSQCRAVNARGQCSSIRLQLPLKTGSPKRQQPADKQSNNRSQCTNLKVKASIQSTSDTSLDHTQIPAISQNRRVGASLMCATKSSSAKIVAKVIKESSPVKTKKTKGIEIETKNKADEIPVMERSGTFLKDEPSFLGMSPNIDG